MFWPAIALLPSLSILLLLYSFFPFQLVFTFTICLAISFLQLSSVVLLAIREDERNEGIGLTKSIALLLAHLWAHIVGLYSFSTSLLPFGIKIFF